MESIIRIDKGIGSLDLDMKRAIKKAMKGDRQAFSIVINENIEYLYKIAFMHLKNEQKSLDAIQECSYKAFINVSKLKNPKVFRTWITRILINICIDEIRKDSNVTELNSEAPLASEVSGISIEEKLDLYQAIDALKPEYKTVVILKYFNDLSVDEISETVDCPVNTVKTRLSRARKSLSLLLKEEI
ncbi:sigma-70 family RNA polymerase sigma factor [Clostridium sp.]|uniref:sigma-70 family RNA polymerase sigma factor n=1 Tax=Clostridium sp. TaxID=1506 RepID=UPI003F3F6D48